MTLFAIYWLGVLVCFFEKVEDRGDVVFALGWPVTLGVLLLHVLVHPEAK